MEFDEGTTGASGAPLPRAVADLISHCERPEAERPAYVVIGVLRQGNALSGGILAYSSNELDAHRIKRALCPFAAAEYGGVGVKRTAWHPDGATFDIADWKRRVGALPTSVRAGRGVAVLSGT